MDIAANYLNAQEVVFEVEKTLNQACDYLDSGSGHIVLYDPSSTPKTMKCGLFRTKNSGQKYAHPRIVGRFWILEHHRVLTDSGQLLTLNIWGDGYVPNEVAEVAGTLGIGDARFVLLRPGEDRHYLAPSQLIVASTLGWKLHEFNSVRFWKCSDRKRYASILDGPNWPISGGRRRSGFGITPEGKAGVVDVQEGEGGREGASFEMTIYSLDTWLAELVHRAGLHGQR